MGRASIRNESIEHMTDEWWYNIQSILRSSLLSERNASQISYRLDSFLFSDDFGDEISTILLVKK